MPTGEPAHTIPRLRARHPSASTLPSETWFVVSAVFHYLGPSFAVLLFAHVDVLGVAWMRIVSAAVVFAILRRPWQTLTRLGRDALRMVVTWGALLAVMNCAFYLAIARLPLGTVAAIEYLPVVGLAAAGSRTPRNAVALALAATGVYLLTKVVLVGSPLGVAFALANAALFAAYIALAHRIAHQGPPAGIDALAAAMVVAALVVTPLAGWAALPALRIPLVLLAGIGVGITSSVIPYLTDQLAMARLKRATYALLVALLPATATVVGLVVLRQVPTPTEAAGVVLIVTAVAIHRNKEALGP